MHPDRHARNTSKASSWQSTNTISTASHSTLSPSSRGHNKSATGHEPIWLPQVEQPHQSRSKHAHSESTSRIGSKEGKFRRDSLVDRVAFASGAELTGRPVPTTSLVWRAPSGSYLHALRPSWGMFHGPNTSEALGAIGSCQLQHGGQSICLIGSSSASNKLDEQSHQISHLDSLARRLCCRSLGLGEQLPAPAIWSPDFPSGAQLVCLYAVCFCA